MIKNVFLTLLLYLLPMSHLSEWNWARIPLAMSRVRALWIEKK